MTNEEIIKQAQEILNEELKYYYPTKQERIDIVISSIQEITGMSIMEITERTRDESRVVVRQILCYLLKYNTLCTLTEIGKIAGNFGHSNILHSIKMVDNMLCVGDSKFGWIYPATKELIDKKIMKKKIEKLNYFDEKLAGY